MNATIRTIISEDQARRVVIYRRSGGTYGFRSETWLAAEEAFWYRFSADSDGELRPVGRANGL